MLFLCDNFSVMKHLVSSVHAMPGNFSRYKSSSSPAFFRFFQPNITDLVHHNTQTPPANIISSIAAKWQIVSFSTCSFTPEKLVVNTEYYQGQIFHVDLLSTLCPLLPNPNRAMSPGQQCSRIVNFCQQQLRKHLVNSESFIEWLLLSVGKEFLLILGSFWLVCLLCFFDVKVRRSLRGREKISFTLKSRAYFSVSVVFQSRGH